MGLESVGNGEEDCGGAEEVTWRIAVGWNGPKGEMMESFN